MNKNKQQTNKTKLMSKSVESSSTLEGEEESRELKERIYYHGKPVHFEITGPVHFLNATNMNVMNNSDNPKDIQTSMISNGCVIPFLKKEKESFEKVNYLNIYFYL
jgi:hypothetical protein